jgi:hypothetical protein
MFAVMREIALSTPGKIADSLQPFTPKDRAAIFEIVNGEIYEMLSNLSEPDAMATQIAAKKAFK